MRCPPASAIGNHECRRSAAAHPTLAPIISGTSCPAEDAGEKPPRLRTERRSHADLAPSLRDDEGHQGVQAGHREQEHDHHHRPQHEAERLVRQTAAASRPPRAIADARPAAADRAGRDRPEAAGRQANARRGANGHRHRVHRRRHGMEHHRPVVVAREILDDADDLVRTGRGRHVPRLCCVAVADPSAQPAFPPLERFP